MKFMSANRIAPDGTPRLAASHLGLFCLAISHIEVTRLIWVKYISKVKNRQIQQKGTCKTGKQTLHKSKLPRHEYYYIIIERIPFSEKKTKQMPCLTSQLILTAMIKITGRRTINEAEQFANCYLTLRK